MYIQNVKFLKDYIIEIALSDKHSFFYDLKTQFQNSRFIHLHNPSVFEAGKLEGCSIVWNNNCRLEDYEIFGFDFIESELYSGRNRMKEMEFATV